MFQSASVQYDKSLNDLCLLDLPPASAAMGYILSNINYKELMIDLL